LGGRYRGRPNWRAIHCKSATYRGRIGNHSGRVALNLEATADEEQVTIFTGQAEILDQADVSQDIYDRYAERYAEGMTGIKMTRAEYERTYTVPIRVTPEKLRGW